MLPVLDTVTGSAMPSHGNFVEMVGYFHEQGGYSKGWSCKRMA